MTLNRKKLSLRNTENTVIGKLMSNLDLLHDPLVKLEITDFDALSNKVIFSILEDLAYEGNSEADPEHVYTMIQNHVKADEVSSILDIEILKGFKNRARLINDTTFKTDVERLNKLRALRLLESGGISVSSILGETGLQSESLPVILDRYTLDDIFNKFKNIISEIEDDIALDKTLTYSTASEGLEELLEELEVSPQVGALLAGDIFNTVTRGARFGKFFLNSAGTGVGKSRMMLSSAAKLSMPYIDDNMNIVVKKEGYDKILFIPTEQTIDEVQTMLLANISGVDENTILSRLKSASIEEKQRISIAVKIIEKYSDNFHIERIADPNLSIVKNKITKHILKNGINYVFYDYIFGSPALTQEFAKTNVREDVALMYLSNTLKELAANHNIFIMSATQLNAEQYGSGPRSTNMLRGSKAVADKVDVGAITTNISEDERLKVDEIVQQLGVDGPNLVTDIYKNRSGKYTNVKIFRKFDHSTCRTYDLFMTDGNYVWEPDYEIYKEQTYTKEIEGIVKL